MELLAPAGDKRALEAAITHGADAVYLGYTAFGARGYAGNFDEEGLREAIHYAHRWGRRVYVTVNTLVLAREYPALEQLLGMLSAAGADAVIVQDWGVARLARQLVPDLPLHASTQGALHNRQGAAMAKALGIRRVVPARECSIDALGEMAAQGVEVEAFVHGALCVSVSGQCLFSSMLGGRSGNRGKCAQPCRLPYAFEEETSYPLSPKDLCLLGELQSLQEAGVSALKIEGRMKRPEYVAVVTTLYRRHLDALLAGHPEPPTEQERYELRQVFHRGGFTRGHAMGDAHAALMSTGRPNHGGILLGRVEQARGNTALARLKTPLGKGDFLQIRGVRDVDVTWQGIDMPAGQNVSLRTNEKVRPGDQVVRLVEAAQAGRFPENVRRIPIDMNLSLQPGALPELTAASADGRTVRVEGETPVQAAQKRPLLEAEARAQLEKLGDTPYVLAALSYTPQGGFLPVSSLNALRREAVRLLDAARLTRPTRRVGQPTPPQLPPAQPPLLIAQSTDLTHVPALLAAGADVCYWQPEDYRRSALDAALQAADAQGTIAFMLPPFATGEELDQIEEWLGRNEGRFSALVLGNLGHFALRTKLPKLADAPLHVYSPWGAAALFDLGAQRTTLSPELNAKQVADILAQGGSYEILAYGRTQLMLLSHCPRRVRAGDTAESGVCDLCEARPMSLLTDRKDYAFPLRRMRMAGGCRIRLFNSLPTYIGKYYDTLSSHAPSLRAAFWEESLEEQTEIIRGLRARMQGEVWEGPDVPTTGGHFGRGVE